MVGLAVRQAEHAFLEDGVLPVPQSYAEAHQLLVIADAGQTILAPVIGAGPGLVMTEVVPGISILAVVFANGSPLALAEVGPPLFPVRCALAGFLQAGLFLCHGELLVLTRVLFYHLDLFSGIG